MLKTCLISKRSELRSYEDARLSWKLKTNTSRPTSNTGRRGSSRTCEFEVFATMPPNALAADAHTPQPGRKLLQVLGLLSAIAWT